jgi:CheY-like chemotaxis protein/anti-sigma regulatory factor (Ser/Thr protein kinase)
LQALRLFTEALQDVAKETESQRLAGQIGKSVNALVDMFDDLLDVSRLDAGIIQPRWQHFELFDLFDRLYVDFEPMAKAKGLRLELPYCSEKGTNDPQCDAIVYSDPFLLERMLRNLVSNAIRYTDKGSVEVKCRDLPDQVEIFVQDTGIGIRSEVLPHIFEEYYQVDNPHRDRRKGLGLGLAIVRRVEELLDYQVEVESTPGQGSTFRFSLKKGDAAVLARPYVITQSRQDISNKVVAFVEDDADIREFTVEIMQEWGCRVFAGESGAEVLRQLDKVALKPDLLVCDFRLPNNQTALDVMQQMRDYWGDLPVLVVTGDTGPDTLQSIQNSGAMLLHKPIATSRLRSMMFLAMQGADTSQ